MVSEAVAITLIVSFAVVAVVAIIFRTLEKKNEDN
jgi:hypothetical protein